MVLSAESRGPFDLHCQRPTTMVILGPYGGGTSCVAGVLARLGVFMGTDFQQTGEPDRPTHEDAALARLVRAHLDEPTGERMTEESLLVSELSQWHDQHVESAISRHAAPGAKHPLLCVIVDLLVEAWHPTLLIQVTRRPSDVVASLVERGWWSRATIERAVPTLLSHRDRALERYPHISIAYDALVDSPSKAVPRIIEQLQLRCTESRVRSAIEYVRPGLRRNAPRH